MPNQYDVIIVGAGNAGLAAARVLSDAGRRIAIIESREFGGTCPNRGCTPKKVLVAAAAVLEELRHAETHGIHVGPATLDWKYLIGRKDDMISGIPGALERAAERRGDVYRDDASFVGPNALRVGDVVLEAADIVIATGSTPRVPQVVGASHLATSDDLLSIAEPPESVVFLGGGVIAFEFAHILARAGSQVTIVEALPRLLPGFDRDAVSVLEAETRRIGIDIHTGVAATDISPVPGGFAISDASGELARGALVVNGTGRVPNVDRLDLDTGGIRHANGVIAVDAFLRSSSNHSVWVCGDALAASPQLSPLATQEGSVVGRNIIDGAVHQPDYHVIPRSVFSIPTLSTVGLTEEQAQDVYPHARSNATDISSWLSARTHAEPAAWAKTVVDTSTDRILGAHIVGHRGEELIHLFALAIKHGITASELAVGPFSFPTHSADAKNLL